MGRCLIELNARFCNSVERIWFLCICRRFFGMLVLLCAAPAESLLCGACFLGGQLPAAPASAGGVCSSSFFCFADSFISIIANTYEVLMLTASKIKLKRDRPLSSFLKRPPSRSPSAVTVPVRRHGPRRMKPRPCFLLSSQQQASTNARKLTTADKMQGFLRYNRVHRCTGYFWWAYRSYRSFEYRYRVRAEPYQSVR